MDLMIKKMGNALYGKFAQRNSQDFFGRVEDYKGTLPDAVQFYDYNGETWVLVKGEALPAKFEFPVVSSFITAYGRLKLYDAMVANSETLIYVDTDCIKLTRPAVGITVGKELGEWSFDLDGVPVIYHRPKLYGDRKKGVPNRAVLVSRNREKEVWKFDRPIREREGVKRGLQPNKWVEVFKHLIFNDDKRDWTGNRSTPLHFEACYEVYGHTEAEFQAWRSAQSADRFSYGSNDTGIDYPEAAAAAADENLYNLRERAKEAAKYGRHLENF